MADPMLAPSPGWTADQIRSGDPYEISEGRRVEVMPTLIGGGDAQAWGAAVIKTNPKVKRAGVEIGVSTHAGMLRAPDVSVVAEGGADNDWARTAPRLAIEYASPGQDFVELRKKIDELLAAGTKRLWVVRLDGPRRVEVYEPGRSKVIRVAGEHLEAPEVLDEPLAVEALYNAEAAEGVILKNMLRRFGYRDLDAVREEGRAEGHAEGRAVERQEMVVRQLARRYPEDPEGREALLQGASAEDLLWLAEALMDPVDLTTLREQLNRRRAPQDPLGS